MTNEENRVIEELKASKPSSLKEAKKLFNEENEKAETVYAKMQLKRATDEIDALDRQISKLQEAKKPYTLILETINKAK